MLFVVIVLERGGSTSLLHDLCVLFCVVVVVVTYIVDVFFLNETATTEIYTE